MARRSVAGLAVSGCQNHERGSVAWGHLARDGGAALDQAESTSAWSRARMGTSDPR